MRNFRHYPFFIMATLLFLGLRIFTSDPWTASVATNDTDSFVFAAKIPLFSAGFINGPRSITIPLLYKVFAPPKGYDTLIRSEPSIGKLPGLRELPGFRNIALFQSILSVFSWWFLALILHGKLKNRWLRYICVSIILLSACFPEIVSWDHVMMSESLSYSLFAILLALSLILFDLDFFSDSSASPQKKVVAAFFLIIMFFWVNTRDTNAYFLAVSILFIITGLIICFIRQNIHQVPWLGIIVVLVSCSILGFQQISARTSNRLINPLINNLTANIFPFSTRVQFMHEKWGMPDSPDIISNTSSANYSKITENKEFVNWVQQKGLSAYSDFMINTPLWTTQMLIDSVNDNFGYYKQPYYDPWELHLPVRLNQLTRMINWSSSDLILITFFIVLIAFGRNLKNSDQSLWPLIGIMICLWLGAGLMYAASYLGETWGSAPRHIQNVILTYRLLIFIFLPIHFDS
jgi:hypothetical protein